MAKVTSKLQVTLPKRIAEQYGIAPGDRIDFVAAGPVIHLVPAGTQQPGELSTAERLRLFDAASARRRDYAARLPVPKDAPVRRDWTREDLYTRD